MFNKSLRNKSLLVIVDTNNDRFKKINKKILYTNIFMYITLLQSKLLYFSLWFGQFLFGDFTDNLPLAVILI